MLKALELVGFKSFADKTRFEFPPGISVVVGPNGSGKSNIVDAIKWVLGEQSAKSLRGKDMADVIFKGSGGPEGRKPMNTAEATLIIDNADGKITIDAPEVHVTRRVYRSGEGEYLINRQPCRLKDIKDLFRGTGVGTDAYSMIEQGKVERILQASPKDRRAIFEEAAGISRFKAKKLEAERRLARVEQNLLRLTDIVEEVESRVRSLRSQASKARRYKQLCDRLQELRTQVGLSDWRKLSDKLAATEESLAGFKKQAEEAVAEIERLEAEVRELDVAGGEAAESVQSSQSRSATNREQLAAREASMRHERSRCRELEREESRLRQQILTLNSRAGDIHDRLRETSAKLQTASGDFEKISARFETHQRVATDVTRRLQLLENENHARREKHVEQMRQVSSAGNRIATLESNLAGGQAAADRCRARLADAEQELAAKAAEWKTAEAEEQQLRQQIDSRKAALETANLQLAESRRRLTTSREVLARLQNHYSGSSQRCQVLEDLERKLEGVGAGAKDILLRAEQQQEGPYTDVCGIVADMIEADVQWAPLIDAALGDAAHHVVVKGRRLLDHLQTPSFNVSGRAGILPLDGRSAVSQIDLSDREGVIQRADLLVKAATEYQPLMRRLLGRTWLVETLAHALELRDSGGPGTRFVTRAGELVESDGSIVVGPLHRSVGLLSRRSELRALQDELAKLTEQIETAKQEILGHQQANDQQEQLVQELTDAQNRIAAELADVQVRRKTAQQEHQQLNRQKEILASELRAAQSQTETAKRDLAAAETQLSQAEQTLAQLQSDIVSADKQVKQLNAEKLRHEQDATSAKVERAKSEQRLEGLRSQMAQLEEVHRERSTAISEVFQQLEQCCQRNRQTEREILRATSELAELYVEKQRIAVEIEQYIEVSEQLAAARSRMQEEIHGHRRSQRRLEEQQHQAELAANEVRHQRDTLAQRLREDYGIEIGRLTGEPTEAEQREREEVDEEIATLRRKISNIGSVNMEALVELEELETRYESLAGQHRDLTGAKTSLERIIHKINADSRRLFVETMEAIRTNFQTLFRKAFGGGRADIVLEDGSDDILEAGIEIIANPPGKPQFSNSLLSGGEKALTAVALLLAVFQFRPSPFCILDEVDAPFDEANIGRFIDVLNEFLSWTRFVIVTHSKKTMTAATTLYGITMQESGVSKRVSVQFEDVSEDGHISPDAIARHTDDADAA